MGPQLLFNGHKTGLTLPGDVLAHLPILGDIIPSRYAVGMWFGIAVLLAVGLDRARLGVRDTLEGRVGRVSSRRSAVHSRAPTSRFWPSLLVAAVGVAVLLPLVPDWPFAQVPANVPSFFTDGDVRTVPSGSIAVTYPYPLTATAWPMVWQADSDMRYRMLGGYAIGPDQTGAGTYFSSPNAFEYCLLYIFTSATTQYCDSAQLRHTLLQLHVTSIITDDSEPHASLARSVLAATVGATTAASAACPCGNACPGRIIDLAGGPSRSTGARNALAARLRQLVLGPSCHRAIAQRRSESRLRYIGTSQ